MLKGSSQSDIVHSWKPFTANRANRALKRKGGFWQTEYYDHLIRDENDSAHSIDYVWRNPEKAGLGNWEWVGGGVDEGGTGFQPVIHGQDAHESPNNG